MGKAKNATKTAKDMGDTLAGDIQSNVSIQRERLAEKANKAKETAEEAAGKLKRSSRVGSRKGCISWVTKEGSFGMVHSGP